MRKFKKVGVAYTLWLFTGLVGGQHYYLGKYGRAVGYTLTGAWAGIGWVIDAFTLPAQVRDINDRVRLERLRDIDRNDRVAAGTYRD